MKLAIISHTEHYKTKAGTIVGWSPTVNEVNHLLEIFDEIYHVAISIIVLFSVVFIHFRLIIVRYHYSIFVLNVITKQG